MEKKGKCPGGKIDKLWKVFCVLSTVYYKKFHLNVILKRKLTKLIKTLPTFRSVLIKKEENFQFFIAFFYMKTR
jgi:hypothetical protein